jgi:hypothetical protein
MLQSGRGIRTNHYKEKTKKEAAQRGLIWIVAFCLSLIVGIFYWSQAFGMPTERYTFITQALLNVLIFAAIAVQAWIYQGQWNVMERQTGILARSVRAAEDNAAAAKAAADAAVTNIEMMVNKERAKIMIKMDGRPQIESLLKSGIQPFLKADFTIYCHGLTEAYISEARAMIEVTESSDPPRGNVVHSITLPAVIQPGSKRGYWVSTSEEVTRESIHTWKAFIHVYGFVKYRHVFSADPVETTFRYIWRVPPELVDLEENIPSDGLDQIAGFWEQIGTEEDNKET